MNKPITEKASVIQGEASESDDDEKVVLSRVKKSEKIRKHLTNKGVVVAGEASESESESEDAFRQAFFAKSGAVENHIIDEDHQDSLQYYTLLHKKLRECNVSLYNNISNHSRQSLLNCIKALNTTNQQLLVTQIQVQDSATSLSKAFENIAKLGEKLNGVLATPYIPEINIL